MAAAAADDDDDPYELLFDDIGSVSLSQEEYLAIAANVNEIFPRLPPPPLPNPNTTTTTTSSKNNSNNTTRRRRRRDDALLAVNNTNDNDKEETHRPGSPQNPIVLTDSSDSLHNTGRNNSHHHHHDDEDHRPQKEEEQEEEEEEEEELMEVTSRPTKKHKPRSADVPETSRAAVASSSSLSIPNLESLFPPPNLPDMINKYFGEEREQEEDTFIRHMDLVYIANLKGFGIANLVSWWRTAGYYSHVHPNTSSPFSSSTTH